MKQKNNSKTNLIKVLLISVFTSFNLITSINTFAQAIFNPNTFCIGHNEDGNLQVYANGLNGIVYTKLQINSEQEKWSDWSPMPNDNFTTTPLRELVADNYTDYRQSLFFLDETKGLVWRQTQSFPNISWSKELSPFFNVANIGEIEVAKNKDGRLELFAINKVKGSIIHFRQASVNGVDWEPNYKTIWPYRTEHITVLPDKDGRLQLFGVDSAGIIFQLSQITINGADWGDAVTSIPQLVRSTRRVNPGGGSPGSGTGTYVPVYHSPIVAEVNANGSLIIFTIDQTGDVKFLRQVVNNNTWDNTWYSLNISGIKQIRVCKDSRGLIVFAVSQNGQVYYKFQASTTRVWSSAWLPLGGPEVQQISTSYNAQGNTILFTRNRIGMIQYIEDINSPGNWKSLGYPFLKTVPLIYFNDSIAYQTNRNLMKNVDIRKIVTDNLIQKGHGKKAFLRDAADLPINYEWWPIIPNAYKINIPPDLNKIVCRDRTIAGTIVNPYNSKVLPTIKEPDVYFSGTVNSFALSDKDLRFAHPFGFYDYDISTLPDPNTDYRLLKRMPPTYNDSVVNEPFGLEIEKGLFPDAKAFFKPKNGDQMLALGNWIIDTGHPQDDESEKNYHVEIHPPSFLAFARQESNITKSFSFATPYRFSQLYNYPTICGFDNLDVLINQKQNYSSTSSIQTNFGDDLRFNRITTKTFPDLFLTELSDLCSNPGTQRLNAHGLIESLNIKNVSWFVSAPPNSDPAAKIVFNYHYITRPGVTISTLPFTFGTTNGIEFIVRIQPNYKPLPISPKTVSWEWSDINRQAEQDILQSISETDKQKLSDATGGLFSFDACHDYKQDPLIDSYPPLPILQLKDHNYSNPSPKIEVSDMQAFPFYGWADVWWDKPNSPFESKKIQKQNISLIPEYLNFSENAGRLKRLISIQNRGITIIKINSVTVEGRDKELIKISFPVTTGVEVLTNQIYSINVEAKPIPTNVLLSASIRIKINGLTTDFIVPIYTGSGRGQSRVEGVNPN